MILSADTPLFETECFGAIITHVKVFPTHITFERQHTRYISLPSHMIASVEARVYEHGFVILWTISQRRIICIVQPTHAAALCAAIREVELSPTTTAALNVT